MRLISLHDLNNPSREIAVDADEISAVEPLATGSAIRLCGGEMPVLVHESPGEIVKLSQRE
jgi:hypothetical protein